MRERRTLGAFTLLEVLISAGLMAVVLGAAYLVLSSAMATAFKGMAQSGVLSGVSVFTDELFHDLEQMVVMQRRPGRRALRIAQDRRRLAFLIPRRDLLVDILGNAPVPEPGKVTVEATARTTDDFTVYASPVLYHPLPRAGGLFAPARDGVAVGACLLSTWSFSLTTPTSGSREELYERRRAERLAGTVETDEQLARGVMLRSRGPGARTTFTETDGENEDELGPPGQPARATSAPMPSAISTAGIVSGGVGLAGAQSGAAFGEHAEPLYLTIRLTAVDAERRVLEKREILWDLENARLVQFYRNLYALPDALARTCRPDEGKADDARAW